MTVRPDHELHSIPVTEWTEDEREEHLTQTFNRAVRLWPDIMESYLIPLEAASRPERTTIMRDALRDTVLARFPRLFYWLDGSIKK